jgi:multidrug efflux system outer membrane protein
MHPVRTLRPFDRPAEAAQLARATALIGTLAIALGGCALTPPGPAQAPALPEAWNAPRPALPHGGSAASLAQWWTQFDDPLLSRLIDATQANNDDLAQAAARIAQARANVRISGAAYAPSLDASASATRSRAVVPLPTGVTTSTALGLDTLWEIDLFGYTRNNVRAARARADSAEASWHDLRVSLAAEVAATYVGYRACEQLANVYAEDTTSQRRTAELTRVKVNAGLESTANSALASASAADASNRLVAQRAECEVLVKAIVALTAMPEGELRAQLDARASQLPEPRAFAIESVPAQWLMQRPDLAALEREVLAASGEVGAAQADRYPRLSLAGSISAVAARSGSSRVDGTNWSIGPALSLPLFDAGRRAATVDAAQARYAEARARYEQRVRTAVREVEEALVRLDAATRREADAQSAALGFRQFFDAAQARWGVGAGSLFDLEQARRNALTAAAGLVNVQRERVATWISLYKAVGGGWSAQDPEAPATTRMSETTQKP